MADEIATDLVREISDSRLITTDLAPADLLFVFGTREGVVEFVEEIESYKRAGFIVDWP